MFEILGKRYCPYCVNAKKLCEDNNFAFTYKELIDDYSREEFVKEFPAARTFPQIKYNDVLIGGYTDLVEYLKI